MGDGPNGWGAACRCPFSLGLEETARMTTMRGGGHVVPESLLDD